MSIELKGLLAGLAAAIIALGLAFGFAAMMRSFAPASPSSAPSSVQNAPTAGNAAQQAQLVKGHTFYVQSCASCHGAKGQGGIGPQLYRSDLNDIQIATIIKNGKRPQMPAFGHIYADTDIQTIVAFIRTLKK